MTYTEFKNKYNGKKVDYDGSYGAQCWDLGQYYFTQVLGLPASVLGGCDLVSNMLKEPKLSLMKKYFDIIPKKDIKQGDVVIWNYGHIAIFDSKRNGVNYYFSQNPNAPKVMTINNNTYTVFRLKGTKKEEINKNPSSSLKFKVGDSVIVNGSLYGTANSDKANGTVENKTTKIVLTEEGSKHPYNTTGYLGWMDESSIKFVENNSNTSNSSSNTPNSNKNPIASTNTSVSLKVGDRVQIKSIGNSMASGKGKTAGGKGYKMYITKIHIGQAYPYQVGNKGKTDGKNTTGFYKASALKKI